MKRTHLILPLIVMLSIIVVFAACTREITNVIHEEASPSSCFACHSDQETILIAASQQWANSKHASGLNTNRNSGSCSGCHISEGYKDRIAGNPPGNYPNPTMIHCFTCHEPHTNSDFSLTVEDPQSLANGVIEDISLGNICVACHVARRDVNTYVDIGSVRLSGHWGPHHGTQSDMLFASNGFEYDGFVYQDLEFHRTLTQDGCLDCHFRTTQNFVVGGHSFNMQATIADEPEGDTGHVEFTTILNTDACASCHSGLSDFNYKGIQDSVTVLADSLESILQTAGMLDNEGHPIGGVTISADSAGALWNWQMINEDRSIGVHNSKYMIGLLESAIQYMEGNLPQPSTQPPFAARKQPWAANGETP